MVADSDIPLIEDVIYNNFADQEEQRHAVRSFDETGHVMICGSFSKTIAPGLRLGWVDGGRWSSKLVRMKESTSGSQTAFLERALADLLGQPGIEAGYRQIRAKVAARVDEARRLIAQHFPNGTRVTDPRGGFILWVELPSGIDSLELSQACLAENIVVAPGRMFSATNRFHHCIRLGLGGNWNDAHRHALQRVGELANSRITASAGRTR
jgi:DNA-binding transcriptional MocR family regulator